MNRGRGQRKKVANVRRAGLGEARPLSVYFHTILPTTLYKTTGAISEIQRVSASDVATSENTRDLIRMMKKWQEWCRVPLKSFCIELLAMEFIQAWEYRGQTEIYYDWMVRDFFGYLISRPTDWLFTPGSWEPIYLGEAWKGRAATAYLRAVKACYYEYAGWPYSAGREWQKIFGPDIPVA